MFLNQQIHERFRRTLQKKIIVSKMACKIIIKTKMPYFRAFKDYKES